MEVTVTGKKEITKVKLSEEVVDPDDIECLRSWWWRRPMKPCAWRKYTEANDGKGEK